MNKSDAMPHLAMDGAKASVLRRRRGWFAAAVLSTVVALLAAMARILGGDGLGITDWVLLACFAAMLPWNVIGFWNALIGFAILSAGTDALAVVAPAARVLKAPVRARVALVMPVHNEDPERVIRHLEQTVASLDRTGEATKFEVFLLSDTLDSTIAGAEASAFRRWRERAPRPERLHYRRRPSNVGHKSGNLWEFLERHGCRFDHMLVLDADSVMSGPAIVRLVRIMEAHPEIGILQQLIVGLPNLSPFARIFQFGMRHGMRAYTVGSAWWQGDCGPYWGHNALVRIEPFLAHCRLPSLPGRPPLGGRVLSHDQVEAVLMRQAGWQVRVLPDEDGSFEENPPTLSDFVRRDLRWCQGNWQYLHLVGRPGLHILGRLQLLLAILMYVSGPAWVLFSLVGFGRVTMPALMVPAASIEVAPTPVLGMPHSWEPWALLAVTMVLVFAPKLAGLSQIFLSPSLRRTYSGGFRLAFSSVLELLFSFVLAPIMAVAQTLFLLGMAAGRTVRWDGQRRDSRSLPWSEAARRFWPHTLIGLTVGAAVWCLAPNAARFWAALFCGPLLLALPFAVLTSWTSIGRVLARLGICAVPEELEPPQVIVAAGHALVGPARVAASSGGFTALEAPAAPPVD